MSLLCFPGAWQGEGRVTCQSRIARSSPLIPSPLPHSYPLRPFCLRFLFALPSTRDPFHREKIPLKVLVSIGCDTDSFFFLITNALNSSYFQCDAISFRHQLCRRKLPFSNLFVAISDTFDAGLFEALH